MLTDSKLSVCPQHMKVDLRLPEKKRKELKMETDEYIVCPIRVLVH